MKQFIIFLLAVTLFGCDSWGEPRVVTEYQEVRVPVSNVPKPPNTDCPPTRIETLPPEMAELDGEVARAYRISIEQTFQCIRLQERVIDKYRQMAEEDKERLNEMQQQSVGPVAAGPNAQSSQPQPTVKLDEQEVKLYAQRERELRELAEKFNELQQQDFDIE